MILLDANVVLRFLLNDDAIQASQAENFISSNKVTVLLGVLAEIVYVLTGVYKVPRNKTASILTGFGKLPNVNFEDKEIAFESLDKFSKDKIDFIDCILISYNQIKGYPVVSFDKKLNSLLHVSGNIQNVYSRND